VRAWQVKERKEGGRLCGKEKAKIKKIKTVKGTRRINMKEQEER
jgi:hypothetical protein